MKILEKRLVETVVDRVCDVCQKSVFIDINSDSFEECATLSAEWGFGSEQDGNCYHIDLCENCFNSTLSMLKDRRKELLGLSDDAEFGLDLSRTTEM